MTNADLSAVEWQYYYSRPSRCCVGGPGCAPRLCWTPALDLWRGIARRPQQL